jgi:hypothetical protein
MMAETLTEDTVGPVFPFCGDFTFTSGGNGVGLANDGKTNTLVSTGLEVESLIKVGHLDFLGGIVLSGNAIIGSSLLGVKFSRVVHIDLLS